MKDLIDSIIIKNSILDIKLPVNSSKMMLCGDSGTGKTYMIKLLEYSLRENVFRDATQSNFDLNKIEIIQTKKDLEHFNPSLSGRLVFIDRADYLLEKKDFDMLNNSKNLFYVVSRLPDYACGFNVGLRSLLVLNYEYKDGVNKFRTSEYFRKH